MNHNNNDSIERNTGRIADNEDVSFEERAAELLGNRISLKRL